MDNGEMIEILAYAMQTAYGEKRTQYESVTHVKDIYPSADVNILSAMWSAIDAYVDIHT